MLEIKNLAVNADNKEILKDFNLKIADGEIHALMGPNGAGKSTICRAILKDPNYQIKNGEITYKNQTYFAYSEAEKAKVLEEIGEENAKKIVIQRSKGLGENDPEMMNMTTMNPQTRRLIKVEMEAAENTFEMFNLLLGDNLQGRKEYITANGHLYLDDADLM